MNPQVTGYANGCWNILRWSADGFYRFKNLFEISWAAGAGWLYMDLIIPDVMQVNRENLFGFSGSLNFFIYPGLSWMRFELRNTIDLFPSGDWTALSPYYTGGLRLTFHPYLHFVNLYTEATFTYYQIDTVSGNFSSAMVQFTCGLSMDISFRKTIRQYQSIQKNKKPADQSRQNRDATSDSIEKKQSQPEKTVIKQTEPVDTFRQYFLEAKPGEILEFTGVQFIESSTEFQDAALAVLDKIAGILKENENMVIAIGGYSNYQNDPEAELSLSISRAQAVQKYLLKKDLSPDRMKIIASGRIYKSEEERLKTGIEVKLIRK
jgi:outer membrane protein OmpA-like peptidoglycan-associated protein